MITTSPFPKEKGDGREPRPAHPGPEDEEGSPNRGRGVVMITTSPFLKEIGDFFTNEEEEEDDVVMATNSSFTEESSEGWDDQAPLSSSFSEENNDPFPNEAIDTSSSPLVSLGLGHLTTPLSKRIKRMGFHDHDHIIPLHPCGNWCCDITMPPSPCPSREKGRKVER